VSVASQFPIGKAAVGTVAAVPDTLFSWKPALIGTGAMCFFYVLVRIYEQKYGWYAGLDSFAPEFQTYWMNLLWTQLIIEPIVFFGLMGYLWKTRDRNLAALQPREEVRRWMVLFTWVLIYGVSIYWGASFFTEQDGTWHQTVMRDTDFTPSHILEFYLAYPIYIIMGCGFFMYSKTRLPTFANGWSIAAVVVFIGPFMIFPNVGLNEWGHTFWFMEELFVAPLHWGFVFFGWMMLAVFGVVLLGLNRMRELCAGYEDCCSGYSCDAAE
jgi:methane/ammonia monooxygenase subunit C